MTIEWDTSLELGMEPVDSQHKRLVGMTNELEEAGKSGAGMEPVFAVLTAMRRYSVEHFRDEEALMEQHGYSGLQAHREEHARFIERVKDYEAAVLSEYAPFADMLEFLTDWWLNHIKVTDRAFIDSVR